MIRLRPWRGSDTAFEVDVILRSPRGHTVRKRVKAPVTGRSNVERWAKALERELLLQVLEPAPRKTPAPKVEEFATTFLELCRGDGLGSNTLANYEVHLSRYLLPVLGHRRLDEVTAADIAALKSALGNKSHNTRCEILKTLRRVFNRAIEQGRIKQVPVEFTVPQRRRRRPMTYSESEQAALLAAAQQLGPKYLVLVLLGLDGGLRRGEMLGLQWSDLELERSTMTVRHNVVRGELSVPKSRTEDDVGLTRRLVAALAALPRTGPFVFDNAGHHFKEHNLASWLRTILRLAGLPWRGTHILRRTCGTRIADGGGGVSAVATHLRHKSLEMASRYIDPRGATTQVVKILEHSSQDSRGKDSDA